MLFKRLLLSLFLFLAAMSARAEDLVVSAAASLTNAFKDIGAEFEKTQPGTKVVFNFAASGPLLQQIEAGAPADVFASADQETMDKADARKLMAPGTRLNFVSNRLVLIQPAGASGVGTVADLKADGVKRIAIGNPASVPVGRYTRDVLQAENLWDVLTPKFINSDSVRQVLDYVARSEVDAGFVYATDAAIAKDKVKIVTAIATQKPVLYPIAVVAASKQAKLAQAFVGYVASEPAQAILAKYGFGKP